MSEATRARMPVVHDRGWLRAARWARWLAWASLAWMTVEGIVGLASGFGAGSIALVGWALSSVVEGLASVIVIWRFTGSRTLSDTAEGRAQKAVAVSFWLLAPYVAIEAVRDLLTQHRPETTVVGIALTISSLLLMPALGVAKQRLGARLGSGATAGEGAQNLLCAYLAAAVLVGLLANSLLGWWWLDAVAALAVAAVAVKEGREAWRGENCCAVPGKVLAASVRGAQAAADVEVVERGQGVVDGRRCRLPDRLQVPAVVAHCPVAGSGVVERVAVDCRAGEPHQVAANPGDVLGPAGRCQRRPLE